MNIQNSVFYVGGSKGGVGKSLFSFALVDYLLSRNANALLVDMPWSSMPPPVPRPARPVTATS